MNSKYKTINTNEPSEIKLQHFDQASINKTTFKQFMATLRHNCDLTVVPSKRSAQLLTL